MARKLSKRRRFSKKQSRKNRKRFGNPPEKRMKEPEPEPKKYPYENLPVAARLAILKEVMECYKKCEKEDVECRLDCAKEFGYDID